MSKLISDMTLRELSLRMSNDLEADVELNCTEDEIVTLNGFVKESKSIINFFYNYGHYLLRVCGNAKLDRLYNVLQRWYYSWRNRLMFDNPDLAYESKDVMKIPVSNDSMYNVVEPVTDDTFLFG